MLYARSTRNLQAAWAPYFDNMDGIIFLAPISCFDQVRGCCVSECIFNSRLQVLAEDPTVNRLVGPRPIIIIIETDT